MATAILAILAALLGLGAWWWKRRRSPSQQERLDDLELEITALQVQIQHLRKRGDHAGADALLRRLRVKSSELLAIAVGKRSLAQPTAGDSPPTPLQG